MRNLPPDLGLSQQPYACERFIKGSPCGKAAVWHIIWDETVRNGCACEDHGLEAIEKWEPWFVHKIAGPACTGAPGARFYPDENTCKLDPEDGIDYAELERELQELEATDPNVRRAAEEYDREIHRILERRS